MMKKPENKKGENLERLVFCKECGWWNRENGRCKLFSFGPNCLTVMQPTDFCSRGKKEETE